MSTGRPDPSSGVWRQALRAVLPAGFMMFSLWTLWFVMRLLDGEMTWVRAVQTVLGLAASAALVLAGSAYRRAMGEQ